MSSGRNTPHIQEEGKESTLSLSEDPPETHMNVLHDPASENGKTENRSGQEKEERRQRQGKCKDELGQRKGEQKSVLEKEEQELGQRKERERQWPEIGKWRFLKKEGGIVKGRLKEQVGMHCSVSLSEAELSMGIMEKLGIIKRRGKKMNLIEREGEAGARIRQEERHTSLGQKDLELRSGRGEAKVGHGQRVVGTATGEGEMEPCREKRGQASTPKDSVGAVAGEEQLVVNLTQEARARLHEQQVDAVVSQTIKEEGLVHGEAQAGFEQEIAGTERGEAEPEAFVEKEKSIEPLQKEEKEGRRRVRSILNRLWERVVHRPHSTDQATIQLLSEDVVAMVWARWRTTNVL
ncbi:cilia- and flagella-associated protein 251-like [Schistocerca gregaria]|uniref:cilia- and flagella-associated protein 251-like n=1 Tax=Schistocerca gregaria TaxID=7010 RepID=UPI00211E218F|nr:cilia- and flagella-associated protein 251-like [Schistocerca gregaria]XP_049859615.1 cilia- and flagella-associated protein 251-like [Schistocerca gregaria]